MRIDGTLGGEKGKVAQLGELHLKVDPSKSPRQMELIWTGVIGEGARDRPFRLELPGIYELHGDMLKVCWDVGRATGRRPDSFKTEAGTEFLSLVLQREKPKD